VRRPREYKSAVLLTVVSKHSRAARRGEIVDGGEARLLEKLPKENDGVRKSIIRTSIKNENLLANKMENLKIRKTNKKKTSALKHKLDRSTKVDGVLQSKIEQSIARAKYVQAARKSGWEQINSNIDIKGVSEEAEKKKTAKEIEKEEEDAYVDQFFKSDEEKEEKEEKDDVPKQQVSFTNAGNVFAALEETEA
jgi:hypothetical protein